MIKRNLLLAVFFIQIANISAQQRKYVNDFLNLGVGARGISMSGAQIATVDDVTSPFWNPAGMININSDFQLGLMHSEYFSGIAKYDYIGTGFHMKNKKGILGVSLIRFAIDDIPYTINLIQPDGTFAYNRITAISAADYAGLITYAQKLKIKKFESRDDIVINIGGNLKIIHRNVGKMANAWGGGIDAGIQATIKKWHLGLSCKDITTTNTLWSFSYTDKEKQVFAQTNNDIISRSIETNLPRIILGVGKNITINKKANLLIETNFDFTTDGKRYGNLINIDPVSIDPKLGLEFGYKQLFFIRGGVGNFQTILDDNDTNNVQKRVMFQPTFGLGIKMKSFMIDYAFSSLNLQNNPLYSHYISLKLNINKKGSTFGISNTNEEKDADEINNNLNNPQNKSK